MKLDKVTLIALRTEIDAALAAVAAKHGITIKTGNGSYEADGTSATFKLELRTPNAAGIIEDRRAKAFRQYAQVYGLKPEDIGREFTVGGQTYKLVGLNPNADKFLFIGETPAGRRFKFGEAVVKRALGVPESTFPAIVQP